MEWGVNEWSVFGSIASAVATLVAGILAVVAAKWTINETRAAGLRNETLLRQQIEIQQDELRAVTSDQRPWLKVSFAVETADLDLSNEVDRRPQVTVRPTMTNIGTRPAVRALVQITTEQPVKDAITRMMTKPYGWEGNRAAEMGYTIFPGEHHTAPGLSGLSMPWMKANQLAGLHFGGVVRYQASIDGPWLFTPFSLILALLPLEDGTITQLELSPDIDNAFGPS